MRFEKPNVVELTDSKRRLRRLNAVIRLAMEWPYYLPFPTHPPCKRLQWGGYWPIKQLIVFWSKHDLRSISVVSADNRVVRLLGSIY